MCYIKVVCLKVKNLNFSSQENFPKGKREKKKVEEGRRRRKFSIQDKLVKFFFLHTHKCREREKRKKSHEKERKNGATTTMSDLHALSAAWNEPAGSFGYASEGYDNQGTAVG